VGAWVCAFASEKWLKDRILTSSNRPWSTCIAVFSGEEGRTASDLLLSGGGENTLISCNMVYHIIGLFWNF